MQLSDHVLGINVEFSGKRSTSQQNGLLLNDGTRGMLAGKAYRAIYIVFPFVAAFLDISEGYLG